MTTPDPILTGTAPRKDLVGPVNLLEHAPTNPSELPAWLAALPVKQMDRVWVAAIAEVAVSADGIAVDVLCKCLNAVREKYRSQPIGP